MTFYKLRVKEEYDDEPLELELEEEMLFLKLLSP